MIEFNKTNSKSLYSFNKIDKELEIFHTVNTEYLKQSVVDDKIAIKTNDEANKLIKKAELEIQNLKNVIFDGKILSFETNNEKFNKSILGLSKITNNNMMN